MKKLLICILCFSATQSFAQLRLGVTGSFSAANFWQSEGYRGLQSGVNTWAINDYQAGIMAEYDLGHTNLILQPAVLYAESGSHLGNRIGLGSVGNVHIGFSNTTIKVQAIRVPVNLLYKWDINNGKVRILAGLGPYIAKNISGTEKGYFQGDTLNNSGGYTTIKYDVNNKVEFKSGKSSVVSGITRIAPYDIGMDIQIGAQYKKFQFAFNYTRGFTRLYSTNYVNAGTAITNFTLSYIIFGHDIKPKL
ncbi:MAG: outer membrane beta-barrel protein [Bacteroidetes bacterium]|nr:outer membrane beta-barrel protein [Bacteroidota bacterium]